MERRNSGRKIIDFRLANYAAPFVKIDIELTMLIEKVKMKSSNMEKVKPLIIDG